jgi:mannitol-1-/sugar-/sorbitol-6-/2-deoxyglucose-6-phosphatase
MGHARIGQSNFYNVVRLTVRLESLIACAMSPMGAVVLDMDGLLIDTEPIWRKAMAEVFRTVGLELSTDDLLKSMGVRVAEVVELWFRQHPWTGPSCADVTLQIEDTVIRYVMQDGKPMPGVCELLQVVSTAGLPIAVASSSSERLIQAVISRLKIEPYIKVICSADNEAEGKPHPGVFLTAARRLDVPPTDCIAFEDSPNGVLSATAAGMYCVVVPDPNVADDPRLKRADLRLSSLQDLSADMFAEILAAKNLPERGAPLQS